MHWHRVCPETLVTIKHSFATKLCQLNLLSFSLVWSGMHYARVCTYIYTYQSCLYKRGTYTCLRWIPGYVYQGRIYILIANQMTCQKGTNPITN